MKTLRPVSAVLCGAGLIVGTVAVGGCAQVPNYGPKIIRPAPVVDPDAEPKVIRIFKADPYEERARSGDVMEPGGPPT